VEGRAKWKAALGVALVSSSAGLFLMSPRAGAGPSLGGFTATAEASGMYTRYGIPGFFIVDHYIDGGAPVAQSLLDSAGTSQSFASHPYPGATAVGYPGLAALALGSAPPGYPFYTSASYPTQPEGVVGDPAGPYSLLARAQAQEANSQARAGLISREVTVTASEAKSAITVTGDSVSATATSLVQGIAAGPLSIASIRSSSLTTLRAGDPAPTTQTEMVLEGGRAGTYGFSFGREGLKINDQGVPLPVGQGLKSLNDALAPTGFQIRFAEPVTLTGGATATAFELVNSNDVPSAGKGTLFIRFGGATSAVAPGAAGGLPSLPEVPAPAESVEEPGPAEGPPAPPAAIGSSADGAGPAGDAPTGRAASAKDSMTLSAPRPVSRSYGPGTVAAPTAPAGPTADPGATGPAPTEAQATAVPGLRRTQLLASPREFNAPQVLSAGLLAGGLLALGALVAWRATRKVAQWTA
jgi:hypothetical protein